MARFPATPALIKWAIDESGYSLDEVAGVLGAGDALQRWLDGAEQPNLGQIEKLARLVKRPPATFLLAEPPQPEPHHIQFRHPPDAAGRHLNHSERLRVREARRLQTGVAWVLEQLGAEPVRLPNVTLQSRPEVAAAQVRGLLRVSDEQQVKGWKSAAEALAGWRRALEGRGILVFLLSIGENSARGFSSWDRLAPLIAVNTAWNTEARIYTMFHELGHLVTRTDSACIEGSYRHRSGGDKVERWCEDFAAAALMPESAVRVFLTEKFSWAKGDDPIEDLAIASKLSRRFKVSLKASVLRLIHIGAANWSMMSAIPTGSDAKRAGGGGTGRTRAMCRRDEYGSRTARTLFSALERDVLSRGDVQSYLDVGDEDLRELEALIGDA